MDSSIRPVCLPPIQKTFAGEDGIVTGWGAIEEGGPLATKLQVYYYYFLFKTQINSFLF